MTLQDQYPNHTDAAEVFVSKDNTGLKKVVSLQLTDIGWECSDGDDMGKVLKGTFYYTNDLNQQITGNGFYVAQDEDSQTSAHVIFYKPTDMSIILGEFLSSDPEHVIKSSGLINKQNRFGQWQKKNYTTSSASVSKSAFSTTFTMTVQSYTATFDCDQMLDKKLYEGAIQNVQGNLFSEISLADVAKSITVKWSPDALVFYPAQQPNVEVSRLAFVRRLLINRFAGHFADVYPTVLYPEYNRSSWKQRLQREYKIRSNLDLGLGLNYREAWERGLNEAST